MLAKRFEYFNDFVFLISVATYAFNRFIIKPCLKGQSNILALFFKGHLNDCLLVPCVLPIFLWSYRKLGARTHDNTPTWKEMLLHVTMWSVFFEIIGPFYLHHGTADYWDTIDYACGGFIAMIFWK
jgi:hypothetical protein